MFQRKTPTLANPVLTILICPILANPLLANPLLGNPFGSGCVSWPPKSGPKPRKNGFRRVGWVPEGWVPEGWEPQISRFFHLPPPNSLFFASLWASSRGFLVVFGSSGAVKCARLEFSGCSRRPQPGFHTTDTPRAQTCTFEGPSLHKHNQNSTRRHTVRDKKSEMVTGEGKKKSEILAVRRRGVRRRGVR